MRVSVKIKDTQIDKLLKTMVVIVDTREQRNEHIIAYLEKKKINYVVRKLNFGDYSCMIPKNEELGLPIDLTMENEFVVEKKNSLDEISGNLTNGRTEFDNEFMRATFNHCKVHLFVENGSWMDIEAHNYASQFQPKSFYNSLLSFLVKYDITLHFVPRSLTGQHLVSLMYMELRKKLKE